MKKAIVRFLLTCLCFAILVTAVPFKTEAAYVSVPDSIKNTVFDAWYYHAKYGDLAKAFGLVPQSLFNHYVNNGITEGRKASPVFDIKDYLNLNGDLKQAFGNNYAKGIQHFANFGLNSDCNRITTDDISNIGTGYEGRIVLNDSNLCLTVASNDNVQLAEKALNDNYQIWKFERVDSGSYKGQYKITNKATGKVLDLAGAKKANGTNIRVYASNDTEAQRWSFFHKTSDVYVIGLYKGSGRCLDVANGSKKAGTNIQFYAYNGSGAQFFKIEKVGEFESKSPVNIGSVVYANLTGVGSGLNVGYSGTDVQLKNVDNNNIEQLWKFGRRSDGSYTIMNMRSGMVLAVKGNSSSSGTVVEMAAADSGDGQAWYIYSVDGSYILVPKCATNCALDVKGGLKSSGTALQIYTYNASTAQMFKITANPGKYADYQSSGLADEFFATITGVKSNKNLGLSGTSVVLEAASSSSEQIWYFLKNSNGTYTITNMATGKVLDVKGAGTANSTAVQIYEANGTAAQMWYVYKVDGNYVLVPRISQGCALNVHGDLTADGTALNIYQYNQSTAQYFTLNIKSGSYLDYAEPADIGTNFYANLQIGSYHLGVSGSNVQLMTSGNGSYWKFERQSNGQYKIIDAGTGKVLDINGGKMENGTNIQVYTSNDTTAQRWWIYQIGSSISIVSAKDSKYVVDLSGNTLANGRNIQLYAFNGTSAQRFTIANKTDKVLSYSVASPYNTGKIGTYNDLASAKNLANNKSYLGYVVFDAFGKVVYCPTGSLNTAKIMWNAQLVSDFARDNGFIYGHSQINPAFNWKNLSVASAANRNERTTSCDRFCDWVLYRSGYTQGQKYNYGHCVFEMAGWLSSIGFTRISNRSALKAGDVVFTTYDPTRPGTPAHVYLNASSNFGGDVYLRYDHGSNARIKCRKGTEINAGNQPFREHVGDFYYAYRPY